MFCVAACPYLAIDAVQSLLGAQRTLRQPVATTFSQAAGVTLVRENETTTHTHITERKQREMSCDQQAESTQTYPARLL